MERIANFKRLNTLIVCDSTRLDRVPSKPKGQEGYLVALRGRHSKFSTYSLWTRGRTSCLVNTISCDTCVCSDSENGIWVLGVPECSNLPRTMRQSVGVPKRLGFLWSGESACWADFSAADNWVSWPAIEQRFGAGGSRDVPM